MKEKEFNSNNETYKYLFHKGNENNDTLLIYFHGLEGKAKIIKPLIDEFKMYDIVSMEQRGHINSKLKTSTSVKKHDNDIINIVNHFKDKYKKIFLLGESMGAIYTSRYAYNHKDINGVFCWSFPFHPRDIIKESIWKKNYIIFRTILTFLTGINYKYKSKIDYPQLTNSKLLLKLHELDVNTIRQTSEAVALWKACHKIRRLFLKRQPKVPIYCWAGDLDFMINKSYTKKITNSKFVDFEIVPNSKHILMYEANFQMVCEKIKKVIHNN